MKKPDYVKIVKRIEVENVWVDYLRTSDNGIYAPSEPVIAFGITADGELVGVLKDIDGKADYCEFQEGSRCYLRYYGKSK